MCLGRKSTYNGVYAYFNLSVKTVMNFFTDMGNIIIS
jgi:hypothetical protein